MYQVWVCPAGPPRPEVALVVEAVENLIAEEEAEVDLMIVVAVGTDEDVVVEGIGDRRDMDLVVVSTVAVRRLEGATSEGSTCSICDLDYFLKIMCLLF